MSRLVFLLFLIPFHGYAQSAPIKDGSKLGWLEGTWHRTDNVKSGSTSHERWVKLNDKEWKGYGVTMQGNDTTFLEKITILIKDGNLFYVADVPENNQPVYFKFTDIRESSFVCENPNHDFPKKISYHVNGTKLTAQISGNGKTIVYTFERIK